MKMELGETSCLYTCTHHYAKCGHSSVGTQVWHVTARTLILCSYGLLMYEFLPSSLYVYIHTCRIVCVVYVCMYTYSEGRKKRVCTLAFSSQQPELSCGVHITEGMPL